MANPENSPFYNSNIVPLSSGGIGIVLTGVIMCSLATFWTGLRFYARRYRKAPIYLEDWFIVVALVCRSQTLKSRPDLVGWPLFHDSLYIPV
jgi:hypothetical protein